MEIVSSSSLVFSENKKIKTCYNFPTKAMSSLFCYATFFVERSKWKLCTYANLKLFVVS